MSLHVTPEILEQYREFYDLALYEKTQDANALVLDGVSEDALSGVISAAGEKNAVHTVIIRKSPGLEKLSFLEQFPALQWVSVNNCPAVTDLWNFTATPQLRGIGITNCRKLRSLAALEQAVSLEHLLLQCGAWNAVRLDSLAPLEALSNLRTLDLACKSVQDKQKLDFNLLYPKLDSLTISPGIRGSFITDSEAGRV